MLATAANAAHGPGIPEDRIAAAMKPFVRLDAARGGEGHCGLGLAIVVRLAHHRGGQCVVANHPEGRFACAHRAARRRGAGVKPGAQEAHVTGA